MACEAPAPSTLRQWRFESKREIKARVIKAYVTEAIELQRQGKALKPDRAKPVMIPAELEKAFARNRRAKTAFDGLTKGRRREYAEYVGDAKREATRQSRVEKVMPMILAGVGLNDKYRK